MTKPFDTLRKILDRIQAFAVEEDFINNIKSKTDGTPFVVSFCNAHAVNLACKNHNFLEDLISADLLLRDGSGVNIAMKTLGMESGVNLNGTDVIPIILKEFSKARVGLYGTQDPWLSKAAALYGEHSNIVSCLDGFQLEEVYIKSIKKDKPNIILLAMGMPKQEKVARLLRKELDYDCLIINGGAILDFAAGRFARAPLWVRRIGMEWFYRLVNEPKRLFGRYVIGNGVFLFRLGVCFFRQKSKPAKL